MKLKKSLKSIFPKKKLRTCYFVHIPKTAGTSLFNFFTSNKEFELKKINHDIRNPHYKFFCDYTDRHKLFSFCFVRDPIDRAVSAFYFLNSGGLNEEDKCDANKFILDHNGDFNEFVRNEFPKEKIFTQLHFMPQYKWIIDNNKICIDYIAKYENIDLELQKLSSLIGLKFENFQRVNESNKPKFEIQQDVINLIQKHYKEDFDFFGY